MTLPIEGASGPSGSRRWKGSSGMKGASFLPLPLVSSVPPEWRMMLSGGQRRRLLRDANAAIAALNWMHGDGRRSDVAYPLSAKTEGKILRLQHDVLQRVFHHSLRWVDIDSAVNRDEALAKLLKGRAGYAPAGSTNIGSYEYSRVSLPEDVADAPALIDTLPAEARHFLEEFSDRMLLPESEAFCIREAVGVPGCHTDPKLLRSPHSYGKFVRKQ